ncbi:MAG: serine hydrolase [Desulfovibrionaceae bacterium]|nr:serine hydrolase [Desulfovibrionaceae bacterium]
MGVGAVRLSKSFVVCVAALALLPLWPLRAQAVPLGPGPAREQVLARFQAYAQQGMRDWNIPGMAVAVVHDGELIYAKGFGVRKKGGQDPVTPNTVFQIGSMSKAFTATLVAMLADSGDLSWKDRVIDQLPEFRMFDPWVTREFQVADLMAQHSGMPAHAGMAEIFFDVDRADIIRNLRRVRPASSFRSEFAYQNNLFLVAAAIIEAKTGKGFEDNLSKRIFGPLGMSSASADLWGYTAAKDRAALHRVLKGQVKALPEDWTYNYWPYLYCPAGGINASAMDMAAWLKLNLNQGQAAGRRLVSKENMAYLHSPKTIIRDSDLGQGVYYCQAWVYQEYEPLDFVWHNGETSGAHNICAFMPKAGLGLVVLTNLKDNKLPEALARRLFDLWLGNPDRDWSADFVAESAKERAAEALLPRPRRPAKARPLEDYVGVYRNPGCGDIVVEKKGRDLTGYVVNKVRDRVGLDLGHWDGDVFLARSETMDDLESLATFSFGPDGKARSLDLEIFKAIGTGPFLRQDPKRPGD